MKAVQVSRVTTFNALRHSVAQVGDVVAVQGLGGLGHLGIQFANRLGFKTVAVSRGKDKEQLARELGADEYIDTATQDPAQALLDMGGARVVLATAPSGQALASILGGIGRNGQLLVVAAPQDATELYLASLIGGNRSIQGWASGTAIDSEDPHAAMSRQICFQKAGLGLIPLPRRTNGNLVLERDAGFGAGKAARLRFGLRTQKAISRGDTHCEELVAMLLAEMQMAMHFE